ncbi:EAL and HDOD domain-containing protein [Cellulomonas sp. SLBN-39]|uniref:EAL and HDOD domain-containing protein n=1 Tax=Cellulomonas sp. SLBN-39 TaxID=2768446 RepID=UPI001153FADE|nr:HDOD domain-containing protein [Cellulomonas sp. SLBN-39]TQL01651.1 EAL and modified HD-GYP domain-containing signal transduction protein [Cellulomonas sp. SLBN-39]
MTAQPIERHPRVRPNLSIQRQPVVHPDRSVFAYAVRALALGPDGGPVSDATVEHLVDAAYRMLDIAAVAGERPLLLRATSRLLSGAEPLPESPHGVGLEIGRGLAGREDVRHLLDRLHQADVRLALADYVGERVQDVLLPYVQFVKVDAGLPQDVLTRLVQRASDSGAVVIAERATTRERIGSALESGAELLQGPLVLRRPEIDQHRELGVGEIQCLELLRLLSRESFDQPAIIKLVESDPALSMRVLHLVNSSAFGVRHKVDSVRQAVIMVGPRQLGALATASLVGAQPATVDSLWFLLTRAHACATLAGDEVGYTVGLLSAVASYLRVPVEAMVARTGVSADLAEALVHQRGRLGTVLAAVLAHEENDPAALAGTGLDDYEVAHAYLDAVPLALGLAMQMASAA